MPPDICTGCDMVPVTLGVWCLLLHARIEQAITASEIVPLSSSNTSIQPVYNSNLLQQLK